MGCVLSQDELILRRVEWKRNGKRVVFVSGAFDLFAYLSESPGIAAQLKDYSAYLSPDSPQGLVGQSGRTLAVLRRTQE